MSTFNRLAKYTDEELRNELMSRKKRDPISALVGFFLDLLIALWNKVFDGFIFIVRDVVKRVGRKIKRLIYALSHED
jgi:hypothetical protein